MEEESSVNNYNKLNYPDSKEETSGNEIDEIVVEYLKHPCFAVFLFFFAIPFIPFVFPVIIIWFVDPYKRIIIYDGINKLLKLSYRGILGCSCPCACMGTAAKIYNLSQVQKVKIFRTSIPDPKIGFNQIYFINCDIYSTNGQIESLFSNIKYSKEKFDEFVSFFQKHLNTEVIPLEVDIDDIENNDNNAVYPLDDTTPTKPANDESAPKPVHT